MFPPPPSPAAILADEHKEPILNESQNRIAYMPIIHHDLHELYMTQARIKWTTDEMNKAAEDRKHWDAASATERALIESVNSFFVISDSLVMDNAFDNFRKDVALPEAKSFFTAQADSESMHQFAYSTLAQNFTDSQEHLDRVLKRIKTSPSISAKYEWAKKWMDPSVPFRYRLVGFGCVEGCFFQGAFMFVFYFKDQNRFPNMVLANEWVQRDEALHFVAAVTLFRKLTGAYDPQVVLDIIREAVEIEILFVCEVCPESGGSLPGLTQAQAVEYVKYNANIVALKFTGQRLFPDLVECPVDFMRTWGLENKTAFFEHKVTEYGKLNDGCSEEEKTMAADGEF